ncbi:MAG: hypothetical protein JWN07_2028 [Hyphomicrobiales bacterium]|nr:hypothetical protein [Hyphomicrobiales bacterium]
MIDRNKAVWPLLLIVAGCAGSADRTNLSGENRSAATWQMPWQLNPVSGQSEARGERTVLSYVPSTGFVRGTPEALASIGQPLQPVPSRNRTVETCRATVESEAVKLGAKQVEAVSAGEEHRDRNRNFVAPVLMRVTYAKPVGYEVRQARLTCTVDAAGKIVDAKTEEGA